MAIADLLNGAAVEAEDLDSPDARRRLGEKILAAFNYAYAIGERDIATRLYAVLSEAEAQDGRAPDGPASGPGGVSPLKQAELWIAYIEARNRYHATRRGDGNSDSRKVLAALEAMKIAYKRWSFS